MVNLIKYIKYFSWKLYQIFYIFIFPSLGIIFHVFYQVDCEGEASYIAHFFLMYLYPLPDGSWMDDQNI
jgi:hypothetical protein